jgi:hypothetical protein
MELATSLWAEPFNGCRAEEVVDHLQAAVPVHDQPSIGETRGRLEGTLGRPAEHDGELTSGNGSANDGDRAKQFYGVVLKATKARRHHVERAPIGPGGEGVQPEGRPGRKTPDLRGPGGLQGWSGVAEQAEAGITIERWKRDRGHGIAFEDVTDGLFERSDRRSISPRHDDQQWLSGARCGTQDVQAQGNAEFIGPLDVVDRQERRSKLTDRTRGPLEDPDGLDGRDGRLSMAVRGRWFEQCELSEHLPGCSERHIALGLEALGPQPIHPLDSGGYLGEQPRLALAGIAHDQGSGWTRALSRPFGQAQDRRQLRFPSDDRGQIHISRVRPPGSSTVSQDALGQPSLSLPAHS